MVGGGRVAAVASVSRLELRVDATGHSISIDGLTTHVKQCNESVSESVGL